MAPGKKGQGFEKELARLEEIVETLEADQDLELEKALALFEEGVKLAESCGKRLDQAERKISLLLKDRGGALVETELDPEDEEA